MIAKKQAPLTKRTVFCVRCDKQFLGKFNHRNLLQNGCPLCGGMDCARRCKEDITKLVEDNLRLAYKAAADYVRILGPNTIRKFGGREAFESTAMLGLFDAARLFEEERGFRFSTYAITAMLRRLRVMTEQGARRGALGIPVYAEKHQRYTKEFLPVMSLNASVTEEFDSPMDPPAPVKDDFELTEYVTHYLEQLNPRERDMVCRSYYRGQTLREIGAQHGVSKERVRQLLADAIAKMRKWMKTDNRIAQSGLPSDECRHCRRMCRYLGRGLCCTCYRDLTIRNRYPRANCGRKSREAS